MAGPIRETRDHAEYFRRREVARMALTPEQLGAMAGQLDQLRAILGDAAEQLLIRDTIEGETDILEQIDRLAEDALAARHVAALARGRAQQFDNRAERNRQAIQFLLERARLRKLERPLYTAGIAAVPRKAKIVDAEQIPGDDMMLVPNVRLIEAKLKAGATVPGAELTNTRTTLRLYSGKATEEEGEE